MIQHVCTTNTQMASVYGYTHICILLSNKEEVEHENLVGLLFICLYEYTWNVLQNSSSSFSLVVVSHE